MFTAFSLGTRDLPIWARTRDVDAIPRIADTLDDRAVHVQTEPVEVCNWECVTSIAGPHGDAQLYER